MDKCLSCGAPFECGASSGECWCQSFETLVTIDASQPACYCPDCLRRLLARQAESTASAAKPQST